MRQKFDLPTIILLIILSVTLFILSYIGFFADLQSAGLDLRNTVTQPVSGFTDSVRSTLQIIGKVQEIKTENELLKQQQLEMSAETNLIESLTEENDFLRSQLQLQVPTPKVHQLVRVVSYSYTPSPGVVFIRLENNTAVQEGDWVARSGYLVGKITEVFGVHARVALVTSSEMSEAVRIGGNSEFAQLEGREGLGIVLNNLDRQSKISIGDEVRLANPDNLVLKEYIVGYVSSIDGIDASEQFDVQMSTPVDLGNLDELLLIGSNV